ncbi:discoidin domain-containing protein [Agromyces salentinus]|uniref:F5/8 type C domain-containing protein n=1 Tax=Agromyces salentinus TaxID=269421 RepID=A0ABN2MI65_9MICO|nr:discoidin domain-containing protein [Agromyces salentinus]
MHATSDDRSSRRGGGPLTSRRGFLGGAAVGAAAALVAQGGPAAAAENPVRVAVLEFRDPWTSATGLVPLLTKAGCTVVPLDPAKPATDQGVDLIAFGSFTNNAPAYTQYIAAQAASIQAFVAAGGVLLDMAQSDQFDPTVNYLPSPLMASRNDSDYDTIFPVATDHPLVSHLRVVDGKVFTGRSTQIRVSWESLLDWRQMRVLLACQAAGRPPAMLEAAHGAGRFVITSLTIDKCYNAAGAAVQPAAAIADSEMFFTALAAYVQRVRSGTAPAVPPTLQAIAGPLVGDTGTEHARILIRPGSDLHDRTTWNLTYSSDGGTAQTVQAELSPANDSTVLFELAGLTAGTAYTYSIAPAGAPIAGLAIGGSFSTSVPHEEPTKLVMGMGSCVWTEANHIWDRIRSEGCDGFVMLGDTPYIDSTNLVVARTKQRAFLEQPQLTAVTSTMPIWATWDDHDFGGNDVHGDLPGKRNNRTALVDYRANATFGHSAEGVQLTERTEAGEGIYTSFRRGPIEVFLLDPRWFSRTGPSWADPAQQTAIGGVQWEWLQEKLLASTAPFKALATGMIWDDKQNGESDDWGTYSYERDAILDFVARNRISGVFLVGGDIHVSRALNYGRRVGYDLWQFIVSPMHSSVIPSLNVPHPSLVHSAVEPHVFLRLEADTTVQPATLKATWINRDGRRIFEVETDTDRLAPQDAWVAFEPGAELVSGEVGVVTTSFTNNSTGDMTAVSMSLAVPEGWAATAATDDAFERVLAGERVTTKWSVTPAAGAALEAYAFTATGAFSSAQGPGEVDFETTLALLPEGTLPQTRLSIAGVSSEEAPAETAAKAIDGSAASFWHTRWSTNAASYPHWVALDLGGEHSVDGLTYLPRQSGTNGRIKDYQVFLSQDGAAWGDPVAAGSFTVGTAATRVDFAAAKARYLRLVGVNAQNGLQFGGAAEITVHGRRVTARALAVDAVAESRMLGGRAHVAVRVTNRESTPVAVALTSAFGTKSFPSVSPGGDAVHTFTTRAGAIPAGSVSVRVTGDAGAGVVTQELSAAYRAAP